MAPKQKQPKKTAAQASTAGPAAATYDPTQDPAIAVIIADSFTDEMKPLTQHRPRALLPVGNVPLIEYALEMLVVNGIREVRIVTYFCSKQIEEHLRTTITYTGKSWLNSSEIKVVLIQGSSGIASLSAALVDVLHKNQLPDRFLMLPVDTLTTCRNLASVYHTHGRRNAENPAVVLTLVVAEAPTQLADCHQSCVQRQLDAERSTHSPNTNNSVIMSEFNAAIASRAPTAADVVETTTDQEFISVAFRPQQQNSISAYQSWVENETIVNRELRQHQARDATAAAQAVVENAKVSFEWSRKSDTIVRSDLINTGILVLSQIFVSDVLQQEAMVSTLDDILRYFVDNPGYCTVNAAVDFLSDEPSGFGSTPSGSLASTLMPSVHRDRAGNVSPVPRDHGIPGYGMPMTPAYGAISALPISFGGANDSFADVFRRASAPPQHCVAISVRTIASYVAASIAVCERRLFPYTRESNFADSEPIYAVWRYMPNVYAHVSQKCRLGASMTLGPNAVIGEDCDIHPTAVIAGSVIGDRCVIGRDAVILHSVILDDTTIGDSVTLSDCAIGSRVDIGAEGFNASRAVVGDGVVIRRRADGRAPAWPPQQRVFVAAGDKTGATTDAQLVGKGGLGSTPPDTLRGTGDSECRLNLENLFTRDVAPVAAASDDGSDDEAEDPNELLFSVIVEDMDSTLTSEGSLEGTMHSWKMAMIHHARSTSDLLCAVTRALLVHVSARFRDDPKSARKAICTALKKWCRPVFRQVMHKTGGDRTNDMFGVLRGMCLGFADLSNPDAGALEGQGAHILSCLYAGADKAMAEEEGFCIVSYEAIMAFEDILRARGADVGPFEPEQLAQGWLAVEEYVGQLREAAEDDE